MSPELCLSPHEVGDLAPGQFLCAPADWRQIPFAAPSMHDIFEARLLLRDFLRDKVSADELAELLL